MSEVFYERSFRSPLTITRARSLADALALRLGAAGTRRECFLSRDGRRMLVRFETGGCGARGQPGDGARMGRGHSWTGKTRSTAEERRVEARHGELVDVVGERALRAPTSSAGPAPLEAACRWCAAVHRVHLVRTFVSLDGSRAIGVFRAPDAESVRLAYRHTSEPLDRVWAYRHVHAVRSPDATVDEGRFAPAAPHGR